MERELFQTATEFRDAGSHCQRGPFCRAWLSQSQTGESLRTRTIQRSFQGAVTDSLAFSDWLRYTQRGAVGGDDSACAGARTATTGPVFRQAVKADSGRSGAADGFFQGERS